MNGRDYLRDLGIEPSSRQTIKPPNHLRRGQAALEYVLVLLALLAVVGVTFHMIHAAKRASSRTVNVVSSDYP